MKTEKEFLERMLKIGKIEFRIYVALIVINIVFLAIYCYFKIYG